MEMLGKIRRLHLRDKLSLHEIAKRTGLSRNTIKKWLRAAEEVTVPAYRREPGPGKLTPFHAALELALKADAHRIKQNRRTAKALFAQIKANGYTGAYCQVTAFIRGWRETEGKAPHAFVPLSFEQGEAFQFDWSEEGLAVGGIYRRMQVSHMKLCASRAFWLVAYPSQGHEMLFDAHTRSFAALGGVPRRGIYDNMKTAVDKVKKGKGRIVNARFTVMCAHYLFDPDFCNVASGWEKGVVEKNVQDSRRRIWIEAQTRQFGTFTELNAWLGERCRALWAELRHPEYEALSVADMLEQEQAQLMPMPTPFDGYVEKAARVSSTCLVSVQRNRYSVPCELAGQVVSTRLYEQQIEIRDRQTHALLRTHPHAQRPGSLLLPDDERPFNLSRETRRILSQAAGIGPSTLALCQHWFERDGRVGQRKLWGIVGLVKRYPRRLIDQPAPRLCARTSAATRRSPTSPSGC